MGLIFKTTPFKIFISVFHGKSKRVSFKFKYELTLTGLKALSEFCYESKKNKSKIPTKSFTQNGASPQKMKKA